ALAARLGRSERVQAWIGSRREACATPEEASTLARVLSRHGRAFPHPGVVEQARDAVRVLVARVERSTVRTPAKVPRHPLELQQRIRLPVSVVDRARLGSSPRAFWCLDAELSGRSLTLLRMDWRLGGIR